MQVLDDRFQAESGWNCRLLFRIAGMLCTFVEKATLFPLWSTYFVWWLFSNPAHFARLFYLPSGQKRSSSHLVHAAPFLLEVLGKRLIHSVVKSMLWKLCYGTRIFRRICLWRVNSGRTWQGGHVGKHCYYLHMLAIFVFEFSLFVT